MRIILEDNQKIIVQTEQGNIIIEQRLNRYLPIAIQSDYRVIVSFPNEFPEIPSVELKVYKG